jgi:hypothetical protein
MNVFRYLIAKMKDLLSPMKKNPQLYLDSDRVYDRAYVSARRKGDTHPDRFAAEAQAAFLKEFGN